MDVEALVDVFIGHQQALGRSPATIRHYEDSLKLLTRFLAETGLPLEESSLTNQTMVKFAGWLRTTPTRVWRGKTERSIWGVHGALKDSKIWLKWLYENEHLDRLVKVPVPKLPHTLFPILNDSELERVFASSHVDGNSEISKRNRALLAFMLDTAVRLSEVSGLQLADINFAQSAARVHGKGQKERLVYFSDSAREALLSWLEIRGDRDGSVFWLESAGVRMVLKRIQEETGLVQFTAHQIRHTALTMLVRDGVDLHTIKRLAGHASVTTTESYLALAGEDVQAKHKLASPFDKIHRRGAPVKPTKRRLRSA